MGAIYDQMVLRQSFEYREFIHTAVLAVADAVRNEPANTPYHAARAAMAEKIITTDEQVVASFVRRIVFRGLMDGSIRSSMVKNGKIALEFADEAVILEGIKALWNETTMAVWPTVMDDNP